MGVQETVAAKRGFTIAEIMIVVGLIGLLAVIALPNFVKPRETTQRNVCINNLRQLQGAKEHWGFEANQSTNATPTRADLDLYIRHSTGDMACPMDPSQNFNNSYLINDLGTRPACKRQPVDHRL